MTKVRIAIALALSGLAGVGIAAAAAPDAPTGARAAAALTAMPAVEPGGDTYTAAEARARANQAGVPLPAGGTFNGIHFEAVDVIHDSDIQGVIQYNAACQWLRAWRDGRNAAQALEVLRATPQWSAMRDTESGAYLTTVASEAAAGGGRNSASMLDYCDAGHTREVDYATRLGLTPST